MSVPGSNLYVGGKPSTPSLFRASLLNGISRSFAQVSRRCPEPVLVNISSSIFESYDRASFVRRAERLKNEPPPDKCLAPPNHASELIVCPAHTRPPTKTLFSMNALCCFFADCRTADAS